MQNRAAKKTLALTLKETIQMKYVEMDEAINADGLRIVIVKAMPSAWGVAAKAMIEYKSLDLSLNISDFDGPFLSI